MKTETVGYTPGPWKCLSHGETISINSLGKDTYLGVAFVNPRGNFDAGIPSKLDRANARLIAAAPELLAALEATLAYLPHTATLAKDVIHPVLGQARAAIAKAKGAQ